MSEHNQTYKREVKPWCKGSNQPPVTQDSVYSSCQVCGNEYKAHWLNGLIPRHKDRR